MRRPVKPFVTEYKGTNRRPGARGGDDVFGAPGPHEGAPRPGGESGSWAESARTENARAENAYEAAMKAADALFAPVHVRGSDPAVGGAGPLAKDAQAEANDPSSSGGRILRALDEPAPPASAETDLPRRRGRKPGSKNKPKPAIPVAALDRSGGSFDEDEDPAEVEPGETDAVERRLPPRPARPTVPYRPRNTDRFSWVRTRLRPGEQWKRRLPKVCW